MDRRARLLVCAWLMLIVTMVLGCGGGGGGGEPQVTAEQLTREGWERFEQQDFRGGLGKFGEAVAKDASYGEAYSGIGWCCIKIDSLAGGITALSQAISRGVAGADPRAGKAVIYRDLAPVDFGLAIAWADSALRVSLRYVFPHDTTLGWRDLRLILAQSYFGLRRYGEAKAQVDSLDSDNGLEPGSDTFVDDLLSVIQELGGEI